MSDRIELRDLRVLGTHGVLPEEQERAQPFSLDLDVVLDLTAAATSDEIGDTVDYGALALRARELVSSRRFALLETLAGAVADAVLREPAVEEVTVVVRKLRPPLPADLASAGVRLTRRRPQS